MILPSRTNSRRMSVKHWWNFTGAQIRSYALRPQEKLFGRGSQLLQKRVATTARNEKNGDHHPSPEKANKKSKALNLRVRRPPPSKFTNYTNLVSSREDVFMATEQTRGIQTARPITRRPLQKELEQVLSVPQGCQSHHRRVYHA